MWGTPLSARRVWCVVLWLLVCACVVVVCALCVLGVCVCVRLLEWGQLHGVFAEWCKTFNCVCACVLCVRGFSIGKKIVVALDCPFLIRIQAAYRDTERVQMVLEFCEGGEMYTHIVKAKHFSEQVTRRCAPIRSGGTVCVC